MTLPPRKIKVIRALGAALITSFRRIALGA